MQLFAVASNYAGKHIDVGDISEGSAVLRSGGDNVLSGLNLSGPLLLKDVPSNKFAQAKKHHKAYQRDVIKALTTRRSDDDVVTAQAGVENSGESSWPSLIPQNGTHAIDVRLRDPQEAILEVEASSPHEDDIGVANDFDVAAPSSSQCSNAGDRYLECTEGKADRALEQLMVESDSLMSLLNGVDCYGSSMLESFCEPSLVHTTTGLQQTMQECASSDQTKGSRLDCRTGALEPQTGNSLNIGDRSLASPAAGDDDVRRVQKPRKKTIKPTRIAASREELCIPSFDDKVPVSEGDPSKVVQSQWSSSPTITTVNRIAEDPEPCAMIAGSVGDHEQLPVRCLATAVSDKIAAIDQNSSCGWSLLDDASFLQREGGYLWIDYSEWTQLLHQERQAAASVCNPSSSTDPHLLLLHDISALEAPGGVAASMSNSDQHLLQDEVPISGTHSNDSSLLGGTFFPDDLFASHNCFSNISQFVGFLRPNALTDASSVVAAKHPVVDIDAVDGIERSSDAKANSHRLRIDSDPPAGELPKHKKQKLGIFATVMESSKSSRAALRL